VTLYTNAMGEYFVVLVPLASGGGPAAVCAAIDCGSNAVLPVPQDTAKPVWVPFDVVRGVTGVTVH
jgi:hypothetical protein